MSTSTLPQITEALSHSPSLTIESEAPPLALPPPHWHSDAGDRPGIFAILRAATDRQVLDLLELQRRFIDGIESESLVWDGSKLVREASGKYRKIYSQGLSRTLAEAEEDRLRSSARSVEYWIRSEVLDRFREAVEKKQSKQRMAKWKRQKARAAA